jgi:hypothetical protein
MNVDLSATTEIDFKKIQIKNKPILISYTI